MLHLHILKALVTSGFESYVVGGAVRDQLLGIQPKDFDICTAATPVDIKRVLLASFGNQIKIDMVGAHFGVCIISIDKESTEVASFRTDGSYSDNRRPDEVKYTTDIKEDLARRDFTINAMAQDIDGNIIDLHGGRKDLEAKVIKCVGDPDKRFNEDALRMLRAIRFRSQLGFKLEAETERAINKNRKLIEKVSKERIAIELDKILTSKYNFLGYNDLYCLFILSIIHKDLDHSPSERNHIFELLRKGDKGKHIAFYLMILVSYCPNSYFAYPEDYKYSNEIIDRVTVYANAMDIIHRVRELRVADQKRFIRQPFIIDIVDLHELIYNDKRALDTLHMVLNWPTSDVWPDPLITGDDLIIAGYVPGINFKYLLHEVESQQLEGTIKTKEEALVLVKELNNVNH